MANANPPPQLPIPQAFRKDRSIYSFFERLLFNNFLSFGDQVVTEENVTTLETRTTTAVIHTDGGDLIALRDNEIHDGGAYNIPLTSEIEDNQRIRIELPEAYATFSPVCSTLGDDVVEGENGDDTSITFVGPCVIWLTKKSDGRYTL